MIADVDSRAAISTPVHHERRKGISPIPMNLREFLTDDQRRALKNMERFGWRLAFVRRPLFQEPLVVICDEEETAFSVLQEDGNIDSKPDIILRH